VVHLLTRSFRRAVERELGSPLRMAPRIPRLRLRHPEAWIKLIYFALRCSAVMATGLAIQTGAASADSGPVHLNIQVGSAVRFALTNVSGAEFQAVTPLRLQLLTKAGGAGWLSNTYSSVVETGGTFRCAGVVHTPAGGEFEFADTYQPGSEPGSWLLQRSVAVLAAASEDAGFLTSFSVCASSPRPLNQYQAFIPGIWYGDNRAVPDDALAADLTESCFICREDRMPLPLVMLRDQLQGITLTLIHAHPDGATCLEDYSADRVVNAGIQVASLGVSGQANAAVTLCYPASEGERSYLLRRSHNRGWVERFHPCQPGVKHDYAIIIALSQQPGFSQAMRQAWRLGFAALHPPVAQVDIAASYEASIQLIAHWSRTTRGAPGVPFRLRLPRGELEDEEKINYQMGFVGQQIPLAYHLLRYGLLHTNGTLVSQGEATVDFWAAKAPMPNGLPRTWYDTWPEPHWRNYDTFLRVACDGMAGAILAYDAMAAAGRPQPGWLAFCRGFGDWLVANQNTDGSWYREYHLDGTPAHQGKQNSCHAIRYLVDLSKITGDRKYLESAVRAGNWCWTNTHLAFCYVGGTVDNPNVTDKEAGFMALEAFLALHDATGEERWLSAARQAADFTETWAYCWNVPIPTDDPRATYPRGASTTGFSLIACGHSGADLFLAGAPFYFYRLYLETGDVHYGEMARQLLHDTRQSLDLNGSLGYGYPGLCTEALSLAPPRGHGVNTWLPWLSYSMMQPVVNLEEAYGLMDTPLLDESGRQALLMKDREFGRTRGLHSSKAQDSVKPPRDSSP